MSSGRGFSGACPWCATHTQSTWAEHIPIASGVDLGAMDEPIAEEAIEA
eukprot:gene12108-12193_t